jgi:predicted kinase
MPELILTRGIPASGKSTWARKWVTEAPNRIRLNRDDFRFSFFGKPSYEGEQESFITRVEKKAAADALKRGFDVVVDATNLRPKYIREWYGVAVAHGAEFELMDFPISLEDALKRDHFRGAIVSHSFGGNSVGEDVIRRIWERYTKNGEFLPVDLTTENGVPDWKPYVPVLGTRPAIIVDVDGTLAINGTGRSPHDWTRVLEDSVNKPVAEIVQRCYPDYRVLICSGREEICRSDTVAWLYNHNIRFDVLYMRGMGDFRKDSIIKYEIFDQSIRNNYHIEFVLDDRQQVVDMWRAIGLTCVQVAEGNF